MDRYIIYNNIIIGIVGMGVWISQLVLPVHQLAYTLNI